MRPTSFNAGTPHDVAHNVVLFILEVSLCGNGVPQRDSTVCGSITLVRRVCAQGWCQGDDLDSTYFKKHCLDSLQTDSMIVASTYSLLVTDRVNGVIRLGS